MWVPFVSEQRRSVFPRKGGGGKVGGSSSGGKGGGSTSGAGSSSGKSGSSSTGRSTGSSGSKGSPRSSSVSTSGSTKSATSYGNGGGKTISIPSGQLFAGRTEGGGTRGQVFGTSTYGSGYPGVTGRGVAGRGFPFYFWPLAWGGVGGFGTAAYLHTTEYGQPDNSSRPGGIEMYANFVSNSSNITTFHIVADNSTVTSLIQDITSNCSSSLNASLISTTPIPFNASDSSSPKPESTVQYYRSSSVALTLDGYNNTGALGPDGTPDTPLPPNTDTTLLTCLNETIGAAAPLIDAGIPRWAAPNAFSLIGLMWVMFVMLI